MRREFLRAPINQEVLLSFDEKVLKGRSVNISRGGLLISVEESEGHLPEEVSVILPLPFFPKTQMSNIRYQKNILRLSGKVKRITEKSNELDVALSFCNMKFSDQKEIKEYVENFSANLTYLLSMFSMPEFFQDEPEAIFQYARFLDIEGGECLNRLQLKLLHLYFGVFEN